MGELADQSAAAIAPSASPAGEREGGSRLVLVRLAEAGQQDAILRQLREAGYDARPVEPDAILDACSEATRPAAILLDGDVPALRDFTRLKQLRSLNDFGRILVIYCQRRLDIGYVLQAMDAGAGVFLFTPIDPARLLKHLGGRGTETEMHDA